MIIQTERLTLNSLEAHDAEAALDLLTNDLINQTYMLPDFAVREEAHPLFNRLMTLSLDSSHYVRGIYLNGHLIGYLNDVEIENGSIELGYLIHPDHQGQGYMTEALKAAITDLFNSGYHEVITGAFEKNISSIRVMVKVGMVKLEKTDEIEYRGIRHQCIYYSIKKEA